MPQTQSLRSRNAHGYLTRAIIMQEFTGKMPPPKVVGQTLRETAQSKCTWTCRKSQFNYIISARIYNKKKTATQSRGADLQAWAAAGPFMTILWVSLRGPGVKILPKVFYNSLCEDLLGILVKCCQRPVHDLVYRSLWEALEEVLVKSSRCLTWSCASPWEDLVEILLESSSRGPCSKTLKILCVGACMTVLLWCS